MATVFDTAKYILERQGPMSTWKLQKLCYYSQAWSLAWTERPLFDEDFEAWSNGPVCPVLFRKHKRRFMISAENLDIGDSSNLTEDQKDTINNVLESYGEKEPYDLREQSHSEAPWKDARGDLPDGAPCDNIITKDSMGTYYGSF